ncbi:MAG: FAD-dependent oxidoreductase [Burkholderiaceae bacterium]
MQTRAGLGRLDARFVAELSQAEPALARRLRAARKTVPADAREHAELLIELAAHLETFLARLFGIETELATLRARHQAQEPVLRTKYKFVKRQALLGSQPDERDALDAPALRAALLAAGADPCDEPAFAAAVLGWQEAVRKGEPEDRERARLNISLARDYAAWAAGTETGRARHRDSVIYRHPQPLDPQRRVSLASTHAADDGAVEHRIAPDAIRHRQGFALTDAGFPLARAVDEARYCLTCHRQGNDSCRIGIRVGGKDTASADPARYGRSPFGEPLRGCPLEERISEFLWLKQHARPLGALAMIMLDNPMVAATGHRICNDCSKACIYQQQTPVDIPQAETRTLRDVLELPWGVEIHGLLLRWNPLDLLRPLPAPASGRRVLVVGCGPAGFTFAHEMLRAGHQVVAIDGLKIEPDDLSHRAIADLAELREPLESRIAAGFGGVAEYGITVRWDKNFLRLVRLHLERWPRFRLFGGVRLGSTLDLDDAWGLGFDHVALAVGAGRPTVLDVPGGLANGVRAASDFLMALQLTGAARADSLANLELRLPVVVVGGGLTAIDAATEARAYYPVQVEKMLRRYETMVALGKDLEPCSAQWQVFLDHARALRAADALPEAEARAARDALIDQWGGVTIAYRRPLIDSPAYRLNPEELEHAMAEGVRVLSGVRPLAVYTDGDARVTGIRLRADTGDLTLPAGSVLVAAGTHPNTMAARELGAPLVLAGRYLATADGVPGGEHPKDPAAEFICVRRPDGRTVSMLGDAHPAFAGNVVRAMASARRAAPRIDAQLRALPRRQRRAPSWRRWIDRLERRWRTRVVAVHELAPGIVELIVHAPAAAERFQPGQFFRLQGFESLAERVELNGIASRLSTETLALTGAWVDRRSGHVALVVLEMGGTADLVRRLCPGEPVLLMGPTGEPTEIGRDETVVLVGGGLGNAVLFSIGKAMREAGCRVLYVAGYRRARDRFHAARIEAAADAVIWCSEQLPGLLPTRPGDAAFQGNVVQALECLARGGFQQIALRLQEADRLLVIGSDRMMAAVARALRGPLATSVRPTLKTLASVNSPMQCMMKEICAQCLQRQVDPVTGESHYVFTCAGQDQPLDAVDFGCLAARLAQNRALEDLSRAWQASLLDVAEPDRDFCAAGTVDSG